MKKERIITGVASAVAAAFLLAGCASGSAPSPTAQPTETHRTGKPTLRVPERTQDTTATVYVNGGSAKAGTVATVYAFSDSSYSDKADCTDPDNARSTTVTLTGDGTDQAVTMSLSTARWWWVLSTGKFTSGCGAPGSRTDIQARTDYTVTAVDANDLDDPITVGHPVDVAVRVPSATQDLPLTVRILGPFPTIPQADNGDCSNSPVALVKNVTIEAASQWDFKASVEFTPQKAGVYKAIASTKGTVSQAPLDGCAEPTKVGEFTVNGG